VERQHEGEQCYWHGKVPLDLNGIDQPKRATSESRITAESIRLHESQKNGLEAAHSGPKIPKSARTMHGHCTAVLARVAPAPVREGLEQHLNSKNAGE
jgi:hypothetical protein